MKQQLNHGWTQMNADIGERGKSSTRKLLRASIRCLVFLGFDPFHKQSVSIRVHPRFQLISPR